MANAEDFYLLGCRFLNHDISKSRAVGYRRFKSLFGVTPFLCSIVWDYISDNLPQGAKYHHLLWALCFLKCYNTECLNHSIFHVDEKTYRKWSWMIIDLVASLKVVKLENRFMKSVSGQSCFNSIDGVDFSIFEPKPFSSKWYSHKFKGAGLRYEIALCIRTGHIVWANGPYLCGEYNDLQIARDYYIHLLYNGELTLADKGYRDCNYFIYPNDQNNRRHKEIMSRHETLNGKIKQFQVLSQRFRHPLYRHPICFHAVVNITQLSISFENGLYSVC